MKATFALFLLTALSLAVTGCNRSIAADDHAAHAPEATAASFKAGYGLRLSPAAEKLIGLQTSEIATESFPGGDVTAIPAAALLRTVRGDFVFVANGGWLLRTPIKTGATHGLSIEITDGLYEGDRVVTRGVRALWLAELQAVNGGVGCADGH
jgi:hypothetical protein